MMRCAMIELSRDGDWKVVECRFCGNAATVPASVDMSRIMRGCTLERPPVCVHLGEARGRAKVDCSNRWTPQHDCTKLTTRRGKPRGCTPHEQTRDHPLVIACVLCEHLSPAQQPAHTIDRADDRKENQRGG